MHDTNHHDPTLHDSVPQHDPERRRFLARLALIGLSAPLLASSLAQSHTPATEGGAAGAAGPDTAMSGAMGMADAGPAIGPDLLPAAAVPWDEGRCAFCGMTLATPPGDRWPAGFRERTYAQIRTAADDGSAGEALHFESIACAVNYAYATGLHDGIGTTLYVADEGAADTPDHGLLPARQATFVWAEGMRVSMNARLAAYPNDAAAAAGLDRLPMAGRHRMLDAISLYELAPWPEMNLIALLASAAGLLGDAP